MLIRCEICFTQDLQAPGDPIPILLDTFWSAQRLRPEDNYSFPDSLYKFEINKNKKSPILTVVTKARNLIKYKWDYESVQKTFITIYYEPIRPIKFEYRRDISNSEKLEFRVPRLPGQPGARFDPKLTLLRNAKNK